MGSNKVVAIATFMSGVGSNRIMAIATFMSGVGSNGKDTLHTEEKVLVTTEHWTRGQAMVVGCQPFSLGL